MYKLTFGGLLLLIISCDSSTIKENKMNESTAVVSKIRQMEWVIGKWENISAAGSLYEIGQKQMILFIRAEVL
nr:hypothetical protein [Bacteroidota bacterium]